MKNNGQNYSQFDGNYKPIYSLWISANWEGKQLDESCSNGHCNQHLKHDEHHNTKASRGRKAQYILKIQRWRIPAESLEMMPAGGLLLKSWKQEKQCQSWTLCPVKFSKKFINKNFFKHTKVEKFIIIKLTL